MDLQYLKYQRHLNLWAFGVCRTSTTLSDGSRWPLFTISIGPYRFLFIDHNLRFIPAPKQVNNEDKGAK